MTKPKQYSDELAGQEDFYAAYLPQVDKNLTMDSVQSHNNDGQIGDVLLEFKKNIDDLNKVLFQSIKYLSALRIKGIPVPRNILLISLNDGMAYHFDANNYFAAIERVYIGGASVANSGRFVAQSPETKFDYIGNQVDQADMIALLKDAARRSHNGQEEWVAVNIDSTDILGWATTYCRHKKGARKADFLGDKGIVGEIRQPQLLAGMILPYTGPDNNEFAYIMDQLNSDMEQKNLGAYYTPALYADKSHDLVYDAIRRFQSSGNSDYIILDRCAGTGNLELSLNDNVPDDIQDKDILSHTIVNTFEYYEYKVLMARLGDKVRHIIPPTTTFTDGTVAGSNALSEQFLNNQLLKRYIDNPDCTVIIYENPPFAETTSIERQRRGVGAQSGAWKKEQVVTNSKADLKGARSNDMSNVFIWSAFEYYVRQSTDSVVIFSPMKYWKYNDWMHRKFIRGFAFNRQRFHANRASNNACILWSAEPDDVLNKIELAVFDIDVGANKVSADDDSLVDLQRMTTVRRVNKKFSESYYEEVLEPGDIVQTKEKPYPSNPQAIWSAFNGKEAKDKSLRVSAKYNPDIIGYLTAQAATFENDASMTHLERNTQYNGNGFHLRRDTYLYKLPLFAAGWWKTYGADWWDIGNVYRSGDGKEKYEAAISSGKLTHWLHQVLFYTGLDTYNKIRSLHGSDGRWYYNELSLHNNKGTVDDPNNKSVSETLASKELGHFLQHLDAEESTLYKLWLKILAEALATRKYDARLNYGVYQISDELNTYHEVVQPNGKAVKVFDYPELNGDLKTMRTLVTNYYHSHIQPTLFEYEFLK